MSDSSKVKKLRYKKSLEIHLNYAIYNGTLISQPDLWSIQQMGYLQKVPLGSLLVAKLLNLFVTLKGFPLPYRVFDCLCQEP